ncbi:MAG: protein kinase, partial [bacterium]
MMTDRLDTERTIPGGASESETCQLQSGDTLGHFTIDKLLGRGGMGEVYLARHTELGTQHAIKLMLGGFAQVPGFQEKFLNEARIMAKLKHPAIVHVTDFGRARGMSYLVMDYVDGPTGPAKNLRQHMDEQAIKGNVLQEEDAVAVGLTLCKALAYAHSYKDADVPNGVVHRDLKPANILIGRDMRLYITDFGLAQLIGPGFNRSIVAQANTAGRSIGAQQTIAGSTRASGTGSAEGTLDYMSPEQREGRPAEAPSDVYAMGAILYELLTGRKSVFSRDAPDKVRPGLNPGWAGLLERCLAYNPEQRFQNATELQTAILNLTSAPKTEAPGPSATKLKRLIVRAAPSAKSPASATSANAAPLSIPKHKLKGLAVPAIAILIIVIAGIFFVRARTQAPARNAGKSQNPLAIVKPNTIPPSPSTPEQLAPKPVTPNHLTAESSGLPNVHKQIVQEPKISDNQLSEHESTTATPERNISLQHNLPGEALPDSRSNSNTAGFNDNKSSETGQLNLKIGEVLSGIGRNGDISSDVKVSVKDPALAALASHPFDSSSLANLKSILTSETNMERRCKLTIVYYAGCLATSMTDEADKSRSYLDRTFPQSALSEIQSSNFSDSCPACKAGTITSPCQDCKETGSCHKCGGNGISIIKGFDGRRLTCISCNGTGKCRKCKGSAVANNPCIKCGGSGQALSLEKVRGKYLELLNSLAPGPATSTTVSTTAEKA